MASILLVDLFNPKQIFLQFSTTKKNTDDVIVIKDNS